MNSREARADRMLLLEVVRRPQAAAELTLGQWNRLLPLARLTRVLPRLATRVVEQGLVDQVCPEVRWHLESAWRMAAHSHRTLAWEIDRLGRALGGMGCELVLLKGAAYVTAGLPMAHARLASDVDLLVPAGRLNDVEAALLASGWRHKDLSSRDAEYYRRWLHELPPLTHKHRRVELDIHHNILPRAGRLWIDPRPLIEASVPAAADPRFRVFSPVDMVLHSAVHLFRNGDFSRGLRDLCDIDDLLRAGQRDLAFWDHLVARARELGLAPACRLALRYVSRYLRASVPTDVTRLLEGRRPRFYWAWDRAVNRALFPTRIDRPDVGRAAALWALDHYPLPRLATVASPLYWLKRLPLQKA